MIDHDDTDASGYRDRLTGVSGRASPNSPLRAADRRAGVRGAAHAGRQWRTSIGSGIFRCAISRMPGKPGGLSALFPTLGVPPHRSMDDDSPGWDFCPYR